MSNSVSADIIQKMRATLVLSDVPGVGTSVPIDISQFDRRIALSATTTPAISLIGWDEHTLAGATELIDLTTLPFLDTETVDGTGLKVQAAYFRCPSTNAAAVTIDVTGANPIDAFGSAFSITLPPDGSQIIYSPEGGSDISGTVKSIEFNGTAADKIQYVILMG